jgi:hypothetical protein
LVAKVLRAVHHAKQPDHAFHVVEVADLALDG